MRRFMWFIGALGAVSFIGTFFQATAAPASALSNCAVADWSIDAEEASFLAEINAYRAAYGAPALSIDEDLSRAAAWMVADMATHDSFGHTDSLGRDPWSRIVDCGYPIAGGENLAAGTTRSTASSAMALFKGSPTHNENMLLARYHEIGIARIYAPGTRYGWYWATTFGTLDDGAATAASQPVSTTAVVEPAPSEPAAALSTLALERGPNLVLWPGGETSPAEIARQAGSIEMMYAWDAATGRWLRYGPGLPWYVQTMGKVTTGDTLWIITGGAATLSLSQ
ncbi:MAG: CAP domain-containing protein [Dehalococcoidia bacterium]|nr:CAP domain-containing protein [Dehalococcoidia bacterium]